MNEEMPYKSSKEAFENAKKAIGENLIKEAIEIYEYVYNSPDKIESKIQASYFLYYIHSRKGFYQDIDKARNYLEFAANEGHSEAQKEMGEHLYMGGLLYKKNMDEGLRILKVAAENNNINALVFLGNIYYYTDGYIVLNPEPITALKYLNQARNLGSSEATFCMGLIYYDAKKIDVAMKFLKEASDNGNKEANDFLNDIINKSSKDNLKK